MIQHIKIYFDELCACRHRKWMVVTYMVTLLLFYLALTLSNQLGYRLFYSPEVSIRSPPAITSHTNFSGATATTSHTNFSGLKTILYWNDYFGAKDFRFGVGRQPFIDVGCPVDTCYATHRRDLFPLMEVDAIIFHPRSFDKSFPPQRSSHTRYVFFLMESPRHHESNLALYKDFFNYTMNYKRDSDIWMPYGAFERQLTPIVEDNTNYAAGKKKLAAWFVTNCQPPSGRAQLYNKLKKYISVAVYGGCGEKKCSTEQHQQCLQMLSKDYKFYLAFENSLCVDYVTEKFFIPIQHNVVPVVYGLADYATIAPDRSFINALDFNTVEDLADYLIFLNHNDTAYNEYFRWRAHFKMAPALPWCELCAKLHFDTQPKTYDMYKWYEENQCVDYRSLPINTS